MSTSNIYSSIDLFAGAGGLSLGLHKAGIETSCAVEYDKHAAATFAKAFPKAIVHCADVQSVVFNQYRGLIDIVCGGPPCQPFSSGGLRNASEDARDMIPSFIRVVDEVAPKAFLMENVPGLAVGERQTYLEAALASMRKLGYSVSWQVLNAAHYGVPQIRRRLIVVGVREGEFTFPEPTHGPGTSLPYVTAGDALASIESKALNNAKVTYAIRPSLRPNPHHGQLFNGGGRPIDLEQPAPTILASAGGNKTHFLDTEGVVPTYHAHLHRGGAPQVGVLPGARRLTLEESAAIQTFPPHMVFSGPPSSQYRQIGNAVPPGLAEVLGRALVAHLDAPILNRKPSKAAKPSQLALFPLLQY